jgi:CRP-like cAMP-binding protein
MTTSKPACRSCAHAEQGLCAPLCLATSDEAERALRNRTYKARALIHKRGDRSEHVAVLCEGMAIEYIQLANGRRQIVALAAPGTVLYWAWGKAAETSVLALTEARVTLIPLSYITRSVAQNPALFVQIARTLDARRQEVCELAADIGRRNASERVCRLLLRMLRGNQVALGDNEALLRMPLKRKEIADFLGLTTTHLTRVLASLRAQGLLNVRGSVYALNDVAGLTDAAG